MNSREEMQAAAKKAALESLSESGRAALIMGTGSGKTRTVLDILREVDPPRITWLTNGTELRDITTPAEFLKWDYEYLLERTNFLCYQTAYKLEGKDLGFVVADEADFSLTDEYSKVYFQNELSGLLLVTATVREDQEELLGQLAPIVYSFSTQDAQDAGILNKTMFVFVEFMLDQRKNVRVDTKFKSWMTSEQEQYDYLEKQYTAALLEFLKWKKAVEDYYNDPVRAMNGPSVQGLMTQKTAAYKKMSWINNQRFSMLSTLKSSATLAQILIGKIRNKHPQEKVLIFSNRTEQLNRITPHTYHSKNKGTKKEPNQSLVLFNEGKIQELGVCQAINRGVNMVDLKYAIMESYDGSSVKGQQRVGRLCRLLADQEAIIYILQPHYYKKYKVKDEEGRTRMEVRPAPTRAVAWSENMLADFRLDNAESINIPTSLIYERA